MPLEFKCLVTFDDTNVKVRFVGTCEGITDFTAQLFAVAGVTPTSYIPHVFDSDFEEFVRLDSFSQLSPATRKLLLVRKAPAPPGPSAGGDPGCCVAEDCCASPGSGGPPRTTDPQPTPLEEFEALSLRPMAALQGGGPPHGFSGPAPSVASVVLHSARRYCCVQGDSPTAEKGDCQPASAWRPPSVAKDPPDAAPNWRSVARPTPFGGPARQSPKEVLDAFSANSLFAKPNEVTFSSTQRESLNKWQDISPEHLADVEDLGMMFSKESAPPLLSPDLRASLADQGYRLVGTHSAVRLSRWTKTNLRGRGACFKRTFYGTRSYETVETSPALSCSSNCVYCWKHPGCPTSTQWAWAVDDPKMVADNVIFQHIAMLNTMKDVQGVKPDRLLAAQTVRHCDLSLVGEPLLYPHINAFLQHMHSRRISTWMYHTGLHPKLLEKLGTTTHLTLSVCGPNRQLMKCIMQTMVDDCWDRLQMSLDIMAQKSHRTSLRLIIIKAWTDAFHEEYAELIQRSRPDFIEVKGVIFCGKTDPLNMENNVPTHQEILDFCRKLCAVPSVAKHYELACEHEHSSCALIAHKKFKINGRWHTWVDTERFHQLVSQNRPVIRAEDYAAPTPNWALYGSPEQGFDPEEVRHRRKRRTKGPARCQADDGGDGDDAPQCGMTSEW